MNLYQNFRSNILTKLNPYARSVGFYTAYQLSEKEKIGYTERSIENISDDLRSIGYRYNVLSAAKEHPHREIFDSSSYRRIPNEFPNISDCLITENWEPEETQYHVHLFEIDGRVELYSHYEVRPDILTPSLSKNRLETHYRPEWNEEYILGITEDAVLDILY